VAIATLSMLISCSAESPEPEAAAPDPVESVATLPVIDIEATNYAFTAPPTFPSGWVTLRFDNLAPETHFAILWKLPPGTSFDDWAAGVSEPFNRLYKEYRAGDLEQAVFFEQLLAALPEWFGSAMQMGGPGFTGPGLVSETTVHLEPGDYVIECYVRAEAEPDTFHGKHGMLRPLIVTDEATGASPPEADVDITLSNYQLTVEGELTAGEHTVRVRVAEDPEGLIRHNVHLARLEGETSGEEVAQWMDWVDNMLPPAPAEFLGGAGQIAAGNESYFKVDLEPGRYALVSETWGVQGMLHEFTVE
jgi:hypothetical protein